MGTHWQISGTYGEACNCEPACPCVFLSPPTTGECTVLIEKLAPAGPWIGRAGGLLLIGWGIWLLGSTVL
jgi:hypothetical protein